MAEPVNIISFGNAKFDENLIRDKEVVKENGATRYVVSFTNGATVKYPEQNIKNNARIDINSYIPFFNKLHGRRAEEHEYTISDFYGLEFTGSTEVDKVKVSGCTACTIDIYGEMDADEVTIQANKEHISQKNKVIMDHKDEVTDNTGTYEGYGIHFEGDSRDKLK